MAEPSRYSVSDAEAGIENGVLKNKLGLTDQAGLDDTESVLLFDAYQYYTNLQARRGLNFNLELLFEIHSYFLGTLYDWAGQLRTVDISKGDTLFAPVRFLQTTVGNFEKIIEDNVPSINDSKEMVAEKFAVLHNEFNAIHPFREGNGRTIRLFLDLLALQTGYQMVTPGLPVESIYTQACIAGMSGNHQPMKELIYQALVND